MRCAAAFLLFLIPQLLNACGCLTSRSACQEVAASNLVFIGVEEPIKPALFDSNRDWMRDPELVELRKKRSDAGLWLVKARYLKLLFDVPDAEKARILSAGTQEELQTVMSWILDRGGAGPF